MKFFINFSNLKRTIFLKCHAYKLAFVRAAEKSAKLHNIFAAKAMLSTLKARYHRLSVQLQVNKSSIQNKQTSTFTVRDFTLGFLPQIPFKMTQSIHVALQKNCYFD